MDLVVKLRVRAHSQAAEPTAPNEGGSHIIPVKATEPTWVEVIVQQIARFQAGTPSKAQR